MARRKQQEEGQDWVPAFEAAQLLAPRFGGLRYAQHALSLGLREGILDAAAESCALSHGHDDDFEEQDASADELLAIPAEFWTHSGHWDADRLSWDWEFGDFEIENRDRGCQYLLHGVHFLDSELTAVDPTKRPYSDVIGHVLEAVPSLQKVPGRPRGPKPSDRWGELIKATLQLERCGELHVAKFSGPGELRDALLSKAEEALSDRTIEPFVSQIYEKMLERVSLAAKIAAVIEAVVRMDGDKELSRDALRDATALGNALRRRIAPELRFHDELVDGIAEHLWKNFVPSRSGTKPT